MDVPAGDGPMFLLCDRCGFERRVAHTMCMVCVLLRKVEGLESEVARLRAEVEEGQESVRGVLASFQEDAMALQQQVTGLQKEVQQQQGWTLVGRGRATPGVVAAGELPPGQEEGVTVQNRFAVLGEGDAEVSGGEGEEGRVQQQVEGGRSEEEPEVLLIGDSQVRYLDRTFCEKARDKRLRVCFPGARVHDVSDRLDRLLVGTGRDAVVVVHVGGNDIGRTRSEELLKRYRVMLEKVKASGRVGVVCGVIPRLRGDEVWLSRAINLNGKIETMCRSLGLRFVDGWDTFFGKHEMFSKDGIHPSRVGAEVYGLQLDVTVKEISRQGN